MYYHFLSVSAIFPPSNIKTVVHFKLYKYFLAEFFRELLTTSKREFHEMFKKTYGVIYEQNSYVFTELFDELERYYARGRVRLDHAMEAFFATLYQKMFIVLNGQYHFDNTYV